MRELITPEVFERVIVPLAWPASRAAWDNDRKEFTALNESREWERWEWEGGWVRRFCTRVATGSSEWGVTTCGLEAPPKREA